jgi:hypothetical protein
VTPTHQCQRQSADDEVSKSPLSQGVGHRSVCCGSMGQPTARSPTRIASSCARSGRPATARLTVGTGMPALTETPLITVGLLFAVDNTFRFVFDAKAGAGTSSNSMWSPPLPAHRGAVRAQQLQRVPVQLRAAPRPGVPQAPPVQPPACSAPAVVSRGSGGYGDLRPGRPNQSSAARLSLPVRLP